ncbi:unnamed protein product [Rhizopus stolonifer]
MGLLSFKRSRKQGPTPQPIEPSPPVVHKLDYSHLSKATETSLMDDIMSELDSPLVKKKQFTPLVKFDQQLPSPPKSPPAKVSPRPLIANPPALHSDDDSESDENHPLGQRHSAPLVNKHLLLRMKERHRQEVTKKIEPSPSMSALDKPRFAKRPHGQLARSASAMTNLVPIQMPEINHLPKHPPLASSPMFIRNSFSHFPAHNLPVKEESVGAKKLQINRSVSAYPIFQQPIQSQQENRPLESKQQEMIRQILEIKQQETKQQNIKQQEIRHEQRHQEIRHEQRQQEMMQQEMRQREEELRMKLELQEIKRQQELQVQHEMQKQQQQIIAQQQQQLQQLQQQQQILIGQQQYQQQQQQQQLLLQQQQIQKLQQQSIEARTKPKMRPLYDRKHCHHKCKEHVSPVKPEEKVEIPSKLGSDSAKSSASTVILEEEKLPMKLKRELEDMKLGRSMYSVPDLSSLSKKSETKRTKKVVEPKIQAPPVYLYYFKDCHHNKENCNRFPKKHSPHCHRFIKEEGIVGV